MKKPIKNQHTIKCIHTIYNGIDSHKWENKMEIQHLISSKPNVEVMATLHKNCNCIL